MAEITLVIPEKIRKQYNNSLAMLPNGKNTLVGYRDKLKALDTTMFNLQSPTALIVGEQGVGKTALVEQWGYERSTTDLPVCIVALNIEKLGELPDNVVVSRMRTLLQDMNQVKVATVQANPNQPFQMVLFIDEIHKLNNYGVASKGTKGSSGAMNALKEDLARGVFPVIGATTDYEFQINIEPDLAFSRRLTKIKMTPPAKEMIIKIAQRRLASWLQQNKYVPEASKAILSDLIDYTNAYIRDQAQPAGTLVMLDKCIGICRQQHFVDSEQGKEINFSIVQEAFASEGYQINPDPRDIQVVIPPKIAASYNDALMVMPRGDNTLIGYHDQLKMLDATMFNVSEQMALLLGEAGVGKTALVEQWLYNRSLTDSPACCVSLNIEKLGALSENVMISKMRTLLTDLQKVYEATQEANPGVDFELVLFIDEIHKLNAYGAVDSNIGSSAAMNALKEGLARNAFPLIGATTDYEYRRDIVPDKAFDRRFGKVIMEEPNKEATITILKRRMEYYQQQYQHIPTCSDEMYHEIVDFADDFIRNIVNPAKSLGILDKCIGFCRQENVYDSKQGQEITHEIIAKAFLAEGYTIDTVTTPQHVIEVVNSRIIGQPLALQQMAEVVKTSLYTKRDFKKPIIEAFMAGTTGTGKTEMAKALAEAFYGRRDAIITLNGGDYVTRESAVKAQHFIGDAMQTDKRRIILLDEIEKSHPTVMDAYMRMIDEGIARDSNEIERSLNSTVIIATSNLGATIFSQMKDTLHLDRQDNPNELTEQLENEWWRQKASVVKALQYGDADRKARIKAEFLQRFSLFVPFLPLAKKTIAMIARRQLEEFRDEMMQDSIYHINIQLPLPWPREKWQQVMETPNTPYHDDDAVSVMIAEDIIGKEASTTGARGITQFINEQVKTAVVDILDERICQHLPIDGAFRLSAQGASFQGNKKNVPHVRVTYVEKEKL